jgi:GNAT superfamily N-acetyltransferase
VSELPAPYPAPLHAGPVRLATVAYDDPRALALRETLDVDLGARYGGRTEPAELTAARTEALRVHPEQVVATWLALDDGGAAAGHVVLRRLAGEWELKRLIVDPAARGRGIARALVDAARDQAREAGAARLILQTGAAQPESVALYRSMGFTSIPVYEPYVATMPESLCFEFRF